MNFRGFASPEIAVFEVNGQETTYSKKELQDLRTKLQRAHVQKSVSPDAEAIKFVLDRWPGTALCTQLLSMGYGQKHRK